MRHSVVLVVLTILLPACGEKMCGGDNPPPDWNNPSSGIPVRSLPQAQEQILFPIIRPEGLGNPDGIFVNPGERTEIVTLIHDTDRYGRVVVTEARWPVRHAQYYPGQDAAVRRGQARLECGTAEIVHIRGGRRALVTTAKHGASIEWLERSTLEIRLRGPILSAESAVAIARQL